MPRASWNLARGALTVLLAGVAAARSSIGLIDPNPVAPANATVTFGHARFTVLYSGMIRLEYSSVRVFNDLATPAIVNRVVPDGVPSFTVATNASASTVVVTTSVLELTYIDSVGPPAKLCASLMNNTDQTGGTRSPTYPNGASSPTAGGCCAICEADPDCTAFVYEPSSRDCWPMLDVTGTINATDRIFGGTTGSSGFTASNLQIRILSTGAVWTPASVQAQNLNGTYESLDCYSTPGQCYDEYWGKLQKGLLARDGWNVYDDTLSVRLVPAAPGWGTWPQWWVSPNQTETRTDIYFHAYPTLDYRTALAQFGTISGAPAIPPRWSLGIWWSRYYPYNATSIVSEVLQGYANYSIPLNALVLDMDWHNEPSDSTCGSWGNFDWNQTRFPDPDGFEAMVKGPNNVIGHPLALSLNVHPQTGIDHCDRRYQQFAQTIGWDTSANATIPCDMSNQTFASTLFNVYLDADPLDAVDVWWTDYGGCGGPIPLLWSNLVYGTHRLYSRNVRPMAFSRYGGLGQQRFPIFFSGDTFQALDTLDFLIQTTPMMGNVLFSYHSFDVGGFHTGTACPGDSDPTNSTGSELLLRWVQFAAVAPIFRTHCDHCERRIWLFQYVFPQLLDAFRLRNALAPYIYTEARRTFDEAVSLLHPVYYDVPVGFEEAYSFSHEYMFGDSILASPIYSMVDPAQGNRTSQSVWIPPGLWARWDGSSVLTGPVVDTQLYTLDDMPLFVRAPSLLPLKPNDMGNVQTTSPDLVWVAFPFDSASGLPGGSASYTVYEDDGETNSYTTNTGVVTLSASFAATPTSVTLTVSPAQGTYPGAPGSRAHSLQIRGGSLGGKYVSSVTANGAAVPQAPPGTTPGWWVVNAGAEGFSPLTAPVGAVVVNAGTVANGDGLTVVVNLA